MMLTFGIQGRTVDLDEQLSSARRRDCALDDRMPGRRAPDGLHHPPCRHVRRRERATRDSAGLVIHGGTGRSTAVQRRPATGSNTEHSSTDRVQWTVTQPQSDRKRFDERVERDLNWSIDEAARSRSDAAAKRTKIPAEVDGQSSGECSEV